MELFTTTPRPRGFTPPRPSRPRRVGRHRAMFRFMFEREFMPKGRRRVAMELVTPCPSCIELHEPVVGCSACTAKPTASQSGYVVARLLDGLYVRRWDGHAAVWTDTIHEALVHTYDEALDRLEGNRQWRGVDAANDKVVAPLAARRLSKFIEIQLTA